ncbi:OmpA family protein, partial [Myxococcota bacterium]|nr:OmpA family protein [Myxococcota bacterium]
YSEFIIANANEKNTRAAGSIRLDLALPHNIQLFATFLSSSNVNERDYGGPSAEPQTQMALGDVIFGAKYAHVVTPYLNIGGMAFTRFFSGVGEVGPDLGATAVGGRLLVTLDGRHFLPGKRAGFLVHLNLGYVYDNSMSLMGDAPNAADWPDTLQPFYQHLVKQFALGLSRSRAEIALGVEVPIRLGKGLLAPIVEYGFKYFTDDADKDLLSWHENDRVLISGGVSPDHAMAHNMILGLRYHFNRQFSMDVGVDIALGYPGYAISPSLPVYNVFASLNYRGAAGATGDCTPKTITIIKKEVQYVEKSKPAPLTGFVVGKVVDEKGSPISGAVVSYPGTGKSDQATDELGGFTSYQLKPGSHLIRISHPKYNIGDKKVDITASESGQKVTISLKSKVAALCPVVVAIQDGKNKPMSGNVRILGKTMAGAELSKEQSVDDSGKGSLSLPPGAYQLVITKQKYLARQQTITLPTCTDTRVEVMLKRKPARSAVHLNKKKKRITITKKVHFKYNKATLLKASNTLLDEVASLLIEHPEVLLVRVEGHTDNRGNPKYNMKLSQQRAEAVRNYLIAQGVKPERLEAKGYGRSRPRYANISERFRRKNRRVEFTILKQK